MKTEELKEYILKFLEDSKIEDMITIDTSKVSSLSDYVIIGSGRSGKQIESTIENLKETLKNKKNIQGSISGVANDGWIIFDLGSIILHLFVPAVRDIYKLEELYSPKKINKIVNKTTKTIKKTIKSTKDTVKTTKKAVSSKTNLK